MHRHLGSSRGLAEIVGTLMLVVIVVAAATAFSFFVASYQKQLQAQETLQHEKSLERLRVIGLQPAISRAPPTLSELTVELASLDVNSIVVTGLLVNGQAVVVYNVSNSAGVPLATGCLNGNPFVAANASCALSIPGDSQVFLQLDVNPQNVWPNDHGRYAFLPNTTVSFNQSSVLAFKFLTSLGNEFAQSFVPPVAIAAVTFVDSNPILDGSNSYQPETATSNVTLDFWEWKVTASATANDTGSFYGQEVELRQPLTSKVTYTVLLTVTNTESLAGSAEIIYALD